MFRRKIYEIIQPADRGNAASKVFDLFITGLVLISVICVFAVTFDLPPAYVTVINWFEAFVSIVFSVEYLLRIFTADLLYPKHGKLRAVLAYMFSGMAIIDLLSVLPFYLPMVFPGSLLAVRMFRLLRLMRILKLRRYFDSVSVIGKVIRSKSRELIGSSFVVGLMLVMASLVIYTAEHDAQPEAFKNAFSGLWWAVATLTTVGYGDIYPVTAVGRLFGAVIALLGIGMVAIPTGIISSALVEQINRDTEDGRASKEERFTYCPHCGKMLQRGGDCEKEN